jgi:WD40 repeat protein
MPRRASAAFCVLLCLFGAVPPAFAAEEETPLLRLEPGGPTARVNALAFSPDGRTLYAAGLDKVVHVWTRDGRGGPFVPAPVAYRVPVGAGTTGAINCLAASPDGQWLAASGVGLTELEADFRTSGRVFQLYLAGPKFFQERSLIYVFRVGPGQAQAADVLVLRGHEGPVLAMAFAPSDRGQQGPPLLVSAARDRWGRGPWGGDVRVWDLSKAGSDAQVARLPLTEVGLTDRPGLAVRRTGRLPRQLHAALAWGDGRLLVWDVASGQEPRPVRDGRDPVNQTAAYLPPVDGGPPELLTGSYGDAGGQLQRWSDPPAADPAVTLPLRRLEDGKNYPVPRALGLASSGDGHGLDLAALIVRLPAAEGQSQYWLRLTDLFVRHAVDRPFSLWSGRRDPALVSSPDGRFLAIAHSDRAETLVYSVEGLLSGKARPQALRGLGADVKSVAFVRRDRQPVPGLLLGIAPPDANGPGAERSLVFDFAGRKVLTDRQEQEAWHPLQLAPGWAAEDATPPGQAAPRVFAWRGGGQAGRVTVPLQPGEEVSAFTLAPPGRGGAPVPVLAVAAYNRFTAEPRLVLYNALTGEQFRQLFGHAARIHSLAATPDGKLLASAAEDQLVCLWGLTDLDTILHKHGTLEGVLFRQGEDGAVVQAVDPRGPAGLERGDRVTGVALAGDREPRPVHTVLDLYNAVWRAAEPGGKARLRLERSGKARDAEVEVRQGVEGRTPLLSLFLTGGAGGEPGWVAWTPSGSFDASGPDVEQYVGWQFNPTRPGVQRIRFAPLNEYRDRFYEKLLLKHLVATASLDRARAEIARLRAIPRPEVSIDFAGSDRAAKGARGTLVVHEPRVPLRLTIDNLSLQKGEVGAVLVEAGGRTESLDLTRASGRTLTYPVTLPRRESRTFTVTVRTPEDLREAKGDITLRYQPPPPVIDLAGLPEERTVVRDATLNLRARLRPGAPGQDVRWTALRLNGKPLPLPAADAPTPLTLNPGENMLELEAVNADAPEGDAAAETARVTRVLVFEKEETPEPRFTELELLAGGGAPSRREPAKAGDLMVLDAPRVRLLGVVTARQPLAEVLLRAGAAAPVPARGKLDGARFELDHILALEPRKELTVVLEARTEKSDPGTASLRLRYDPPLPELDLVEPEANKVLLDRQHRGSGEVEVTGVLRPAADFYPFEVQIWVSGKGKAGPAEKERPPDVIVPFKGEADLPAGGKPARLARLRLGPGSSRVQVQVTNGARTGEPLVRYVSYRQPPRVVGALRVPATVRDPFARVEARVESPSDLPLTEVVVNGKQYPVKDVATSADGPRAGLTTWAVRVDKVPLGDQGTNPVRLEVRNADGTDEAVAAVQVMQEPPQKARIEVLNLPPEGNLPHAHFDLDVRVESVSELRGLRLKRGAESRDLRAAEAVARPQGYYEWRKKVPLDLTEGDNPLVIEAENAGGVKAEAVKLTYVPLPVRLLLIQPEAAVRDAEMKLRGKVAWRDPGQARRVIDQLGQVKVYVNDHLQAPPRALPRDPDAKEQPFVVDLTLNQRDNDIQVECPFPLEYESQRSTHVVCERPEAPGTLRVLLVNAAEEAVADEDFMKRALDALQVEGEGARRRSRAFGRVVLYPYSRGQARPLGRVTRDKVRLWLTAIRQDVEEDAGTRRGRPSDVVLVYWLGKDLVQDEKGDWYLPTSDTDREPLKSPSVTAQPLAELLDADREVPGARLLLLDLAAPKAGEESAADWPRSRAAVLRYLWAGDAVPVPGLIAALQTAARGKGPVSLEEWDRTAARLTAPLQQQYRAAVRLTERLPTSLSSLVVARPAPR